MKNIFFALGIFWMGTIVAFPNMKEFPHREVSLPAGKKAYESLKPITFVKVTDSKGISLNGWCPETEHCIKIFDVIFEDGEWKFGDHPRCYVISTSNTKQIDFAKEWKEIEFKEEIKLVQFDFINKNKTVGRFDLAYIGSQYFGGWISFECPEQN